MKPLDRSQPPASGSIRDFDFPEVDRRALPNGLDLRIAKLSRLPVVSVTLFMRAGEADLDSDRAGLAVLTGDALEGGTARRSGTELAEALEGIGARVGANTGWEGTSVSMSCLADRLEEGLGLLAEAVLEPAFPEDEVERGREQRLAAIRQRAMDPAALASDAAAGRIFASNVPYARPLGGTEASIGPMTRARLRGYTEAFYRPERGGLVVVGDVDPSEIEELAARHLGAWSGSPPPAAGFEVEAPTRERRVWIVDRPGSVQSEIRIGHLGAARSTPDYFPLSVVNMLFGGSFTSRLNLNLRERNGFTYGVRSRFGFRTRPGPFLVSTSVGTEVTAPAVREIIAELEGLVEGGPTDEEVAAARDFAAGVFGLQLETVGQIGTRLTQLVVYGLEDGYYHRYRDNIRAVTTEEAADAARRHIRPDEAQIVVVGDAETIRAPLEALGLGPVEVTTGGASDE
jgi:zinc protease